MRATLEFDLNDEGDREEFALLQQAEGYRDAFQDVWKYVKAVLDYHSDEHAPAWNEAFRNVQERISRIAEENDVAVW
jgi:hypothetical protein